MAEHTYGDHVISGSPYDQMKGILARHLCGWITGHHGPADNADNANHFLEDAEMILNEAHDHGIRFHLTDHNMNSINPSDGFVAVSLFNTLASHGGQYNATER